MNESNAAIWSFYLVPVVEKDVPSIGAY